jgi:hypothetical protein
MGEVSRTETKTAGGLHVCQSCRSQLVQPTRWEQTAERGQWRLWRRCPECGWQAEGVFGESEIDAYDEDLDNGTEALAAELKGLERENMEWIADAFAVALAADLITAEDFT